MTVRAEDGRKLGTVIECTEDGFVVEKGIFFPKDFHVRYEQVVAVRDGEAYLDSAELGAGAPADSGIEAEAGPAIASHEPIRQADVTGAPLAGSREEVRVPPAAEEPTAEKRERQAGEVRIHEEVVAEQRQISVPVTREEVKVERVPATGATPPEAAFQEGTVAVPVREEEVEIHERPVVKEEVKVSRTRRQEERRADAEVRHEAARIEGHGEIGRGPGDPASPRTDFDDPER
jgi:uncharacterized protein (TIGR02271 family)